MNMEDSEDEERLVCGDQSITAEYVAELKRIIATLRAEIDYLKPRVVGKSAPHFNPPVQVAETNENFWFGENKTEPLPPIKCVNCEE